MNTTNNNRLTKKAQTLRKNMTKEERLLWYEFLKSLPITFNRQKVIGNYIVDFYCAFVKIVIEIDGSQHFSEENIVLDKERDKYLNSLGLRVLRYNNLEIKRNFKGVCEDIIKVIKERSTSSVTYVTPSPQGEGLCLGELYIFIISSYQLRCN